MNTLNTTDAIPISEVDKLEICRTAAKSILRRGGRGYKLDELVNEGYVHITGPTQYPGIAYRQAHHYMLQLINRCGIGKRVEATRKTPNPDSNEMQVFINVDKREPMVVDTASIDDMIDVRCALDGLTPEELQLIDERFVQDMTFQQMAAIHGKKFGTSIKFQIDNILLKLKARLSK